MKKIISITILSLSLFSTNSIAEDYVSYYQYSQDKNKIDQKLGSINNKIEQNEINTNTAMQKAERAKSAADDADLKAISAKKYADMAQKTADTAQEKATTAESKAKEALVVANNKVDQKTFDKSVSEVNGKIDNNTSAIKDLGDKTEKSFKQVQSDINDKATETLGKANEHAGAVATKAKNEAISEANNYTNSKFAQFSKRIDKVRNEANAGISSALAASQVPQVDTNSRFSLGAGVGGYNGQSAVAVGMSARIYDYTVTKFTVTTDSQNNFGFGAGVAVNW